jgi:hypothetical protein
MVKCYIRQRGSRKAPLVTCRFTDTLAVMVMEAGVGLGKGNSRNKKTVTPFLENRAPMIETSARRKMLRVLDGVSSIRVEGPAELSCGLCSNRAAMLQVTSD